MTNANDCVPEARQRARTSGRRQFINHVDQPIATWLIQDQPWLSCALVVNPDGSVEAYDVADIDQRLNGQTSRYTCV